MIQANNPALTSWVKVDTSSDFPIQNLPFGVFKTSSKSARVGSIIGDQVIDLSVLAEKGYFEDLAIDLSVFFESSLNAFMELGRPACTLVRNKLSKLLAEGNTVLASAKEDHKEVFHAVAQVELVLPVQIGDYTDFYSSIEHATNVGKMFRDPENALLPNWKHIPVGYHGRASSIVVSGTPLHRPMGQQLPKGETTPVFGPSKLVDFELEMAFVTCKNNPLGDRVSTEQAEEAIWGMALFNDWSARDIQKWEYVPLGPFLAKNFGSSLSPWIVTMDALEPFRVGGPKQDPAVFPYLEYEGDKNYDINLQVFIQPEGGAAHQVSQSNFKYMYWNMAQQLAHHTVNGCNVKVGDLYASGTISGPTPDSYGSMLEICWQGTKPVAMPDGSERKFIADNDTVIMKGYCENDGVRIGFGEVSTKILPVK